VTSLNSHINMNYLLQLTLVMLVSVYAFSFIEAQFLSGGFGNVDSDSARRAACFQCIISNSTFVNACIFCAAGVLMED
ncbi:hypothetical protein Bpfe_002540, partial [Biomphalaria pfeifferi]